MARKQPIIWGAIQFIKKIVYALPHNCACVLGGKMGLLVYLFSKKKVENAIRRCRVALTVSENQAREIVKASYKHFGIAAVEFLRLPIMLDKLDGLVRVHGEKYLNDALAYGKGVMFITAHLGNWEYAAALFAKHGYPVNGLVAEQRDERITKLIEDTRIASKVKVLYKNNDLKKMIGLLKKGEIIAVPIDQDARDKGVLSPFLGIPASTPVGVAKLADKLDCKVISGFCVRAKDGIYDFYFLPAFEGKNGKRFGEDVQESMNQCNEVISEWIRKYPKQWMWLYPRWESVGEEKFDESLR